MTFPRIGTILTMFFMVVVPISVAAADTPVGTIDTSTLVSEKSKFSLSGYAFGTPAVQVIIHKEGASKVLFKSKAIKVRDYVWKSSVSKRLPDGRYDVELMATNSKGKKPQLVATGKLVIGKDARVATTLVVAPVPLLRGGVARASASVPISYLQVTNVGKVAAVVKGFYLKQNGSAPGNVVIGLTTVDDKGGSRGATTALEGATPFVNGVAYAPTNATFEPGQMRLFTIRAVVTQNVQAYIGKQLMIDVTGVDSNATVQGGFPIRGTTLTVSN